MFGLRVQIYNIKKIIFNLDTFFLLSLIVMYSLDSSTKMTSFSTNWRGNRSHNYTKWVKMYSFYQ